MLIVDDNPGMRRLIRLIIAAVSTDIAECEDGAQVLDAYRRTRPDWVLMDYEMATVDGITATRRLRAVHPEARVVIVTNYDGSALREAAAEAGACSYILKENLIELRTLLAS